MMDSVMKIERPAVQPAAIGEPAVPAWFASRREAARLAWRDLPWPGPRDRDWRNSPIEAFREPGTAPREGPGASSGIRERAKDQDFAAVLRFVDGALVSDPGACLAVPGLGFGLGPAALPARPPHSVDASDLEDKLQARLWAEASSVVSVTLAEDRILDRPILIEWVETGRAPYRAPLLFLKLGQGSRARIDLLWSSSDARAPGGAFLSPALRIDMGAGSRLDIFEVVDLGPSSRFLDYPRANLGAGAELGWTRGFLGTGLARSRLRADLAGRASRFSLSASYAVGGGQHLETSVVQHHIGEASWSRSRFEGVVDGDGRAVCHGLIKVEESAIGTDAYLSSRALALSPEARTVSLPELAIDTNELTASHGSTVGSVGPEELFYLGTRGLSPAQAKALVAAGILGGLLASCPPELAAYVESRIDEVLEPGPQIAGAGNG